MSHSRFGNLRCPVRSSCSPSRHQRPRQRDRILEPPSRPKASLIRQTSGLSSPRPQQPSGLMRPLFDRAVRSMTVAVIDVADDEVVELWAAPDDGAVEEFASDRLRSSAQRTR